MARQPNRLDDREVSLIKAMIVSGRFLDGQTILAYFSRPCRTVNHRVIGEIRAAMMREPVPQRARRFVPQPVATETELENFLTEHPRIDPKTGLHLDDDELLIKAREAMLLAVQAFNNPSAYFKAEIFIVAACIAWTYLLHAYYRLEGIEYVYRDHKTGGVLQTKHGSPRHYDLAQCLTIPQRPLDYGVVRNLDYLLGVRHEIEHQKTSRIDDAISAKLQACCLNFNAAIKRLFGDRCGLDRELSLALQFARIDAVQRGLTAAHTDLPKAVQSFNAAFEGGLSEDEYNDPAYAYRVALVPVTINNRRKADEVFEIIDRNSPEAEKLNIVLRDREPPKLRPKGVVKRMHALGFTRFNMHHHTQLWKELEAKKPGKGYGTDVAGAWYWYERWVERVREHCEVHADLYRAVAA